MAEKSKKDGGQRYNWNLIMNDYITHADSSLEKISEKYGIRLATVKKHSSAESWLATKREYQKKVRQKAAQKVLPEKVNALVKELKSVDKASNIIVDMFNDADQFKRHVVEIGEGKGEYHSEEVILNKVDTRALKDALGCLKLIEDMKRSMLEEQKINERQRYEIELARLELEKERLALEKERNALRSQNTGSDAESIYGVVLIPEVMADEETDDNSTPES